MATTYEQRLDVANRALQSFAPKIRLYHDGRFLRMATKHYDWPAHLRRDGTWPQYGYHKLPTGGTGQQALAQLIRYVRDLTRLPLLTWEYWSSDTVALCNADTVRILREGGYGDPGKTCCVLCGDTEFKRGLDWWDLDGITGPCCWGGRCRHKKEGKQV